MADYEALARMAGIESPLDRAVDKALARINQEAIDNPAPIEPIYYAEDGITPVPRFPKGTPEYEAYAASLREALADPHAFDYLFPED